MKRFYLAALLGLLVSARGLAQDYQVVADPSGKYGYQVDGMWMIAPSFDYAKPFSDGLALVRVGGKYGFIGPDGQLAIPAKYEDAGTFGEGLAPVCLYGKYGFIGKDGSMVFPFKYDFAGSFSEGLALVSLNGKMTYMAPDGSLLTPYMLESGKPFDNGVAEVRMGGQTKWMDKEGNLFDEESEAFSSFSGFARQFVEERVNAWQKKGRYEKTADWMARVNESTRDLLVDSLLGVAQREYIDRMSKGLDNYQTIVNYDADGEIFLVQDSRFGSLLVPVPIDEAAAFESAFANATKTPVYAIQDDGLGLREMTYTLPGGQEYRYDNSSDLTFALADIDYEFDAIDINAVADDQLASTGGRQQITSRKVSVGKSDVDLNIPQATATNDKTFAVVIANENYTRLAAVPFARNDGETFGEYCTQTLGLPEANVRFYPDATYATMLAAVRDIRNIASAYHGDIRVLFYYAGHGAPDDATKQAYLLPVDAYGVDSETCYSLARLYDELGDLGAQSVAVFLDACFSGAARDGEGAMLASARGVAIRPRTEAATGNLVVFSAASGDETALPYAEKGHGLFTYFLLKKLQQSGGNVTLGELGDYLGTQVRQQSSVVNRKNQTPTVTAGAALGDTWKDLTLK